MSDTIRETLNALVPEGSTHAEVQAAMLGVLETNGMLREDLDRVRQMFKAEDHEWFTISNANEVHGLSKEDLDKWSGQIREAIVGNTWIKAGIRLRNSYVLQGGGIYYENIPDRADARSSTRNVQACIDNAINQAQFFGMGARKERESALYSDGNVFYLGNNDTFELESIPLWEIQGDYRNPENDAQIWAYRRVWQDRSSESNNDPFVRWYFTDTYASKAIDPRTNRLVTHIPYNGQNEQVDPKKTMFDGRVNTQLGWAYGVPDALAALIWARIYRDFMTNGKIMNDALATFAFNAVQKTAKGATNVGLQLGRSRAGSTVVTGGANELTPLSSAGKTYDFGAGVPLLAAVATAIGVSVIHISADPGSAGASYGSAATLDLPTLLATNDRRDWHVEFDQRVLRWMGARDAHVYFKPLTNSTELLRMIQAFTALWNTGNYSSEEFRTLVDDLLGTKPGKAPEGVMLPNNSKYVDTLTNDGQKETTDAAAKAKSATGQGKATKAGNNPKNQDLRTDTLANALASIESDVLAERLEAVVSRLEQFLEAA